MDDLAIIGAGVTGLAAAYRLRQLGLDWNITIYEKSRGVGGRVATRRKAGCVYDHGAQYFKTETTEMERLVLHELPRDGLRDIGRDVWVFDGENRISVGDPQQNAAPKWNYVDGISKLAKLLAAAARAAIRTEILLGRLVRTNDGYHLFDTEGQQVGVSQRVLITAPAEQTSQILAASEIDSERQNTASSLLKEIEYTRSLSVVLGYTPRPYQRPYYALVNIDRVHPISWVAFEHDKGSERVPADQGVLIIQMADRYSRDHYETAVDQVASEATELVSTLLDEDLRTPAWTDVQRWRYALPRTFVSLAKLNENADCLYIAGDMTHGARVHLGVQSGLEVAQIIAGKE